MVRILNAVPQRSIVVVEDEESIATALADRLRSEGYWVEVAGDGVTGVELCRTTRPNLVVLDLMLPGLDGLEVCRRIQTDRPTPVLILTARDTETDLLVGLGVGADDYMTKPFSPRELVARVAAILRRVSRSAEEAAPSRLQLGEVEVEPATRRVRRAGVPIHLTPTEFDLLTCLVGHGGAVLTRQELLAQVWGFGGGLGARTVDSHVQALRRKLGPELVRTVHGVGYAIDAAVPGPAS